MTKTKLVILGAGARGRDLAGVIRDINNHPSAEHTYDIMGFLDNDESKWGSDIYGIEILGGLPDAKELPEDVKFINTIGGPSYFWKLEKIVRETGIPDERFETIIHPDAYVAETASLGHGVFIFPDSTVYEGTEVGNHVQIIDSRIGHDVSIGDFTLIQGNAEVGGKIEGPCYIAKNSTIRDNSINIERNTLVGMGSVVVDDVEEGQVVAGVPAEHIRDVKKTSEDYSDL